MTGLPTKLDRIALTREEEPIVNTISSDSNSQVGKVVYPRSIFRRLNINVSFQHERFFMSGGKPPFPTCEFPLLEWSCDLFFREFGQYNTWKSLHSTLEESH
jgi:hypothetical protein